MHMKEITLRDLPFCQIGHAFAQHLRAQAAAEGDDDGLPLLRAQRAACGGTVLPEHLLPHRVARNDRLVRRAQTLHGVGHGREHQVHLLCQDLVGHAGESVLLVNGRADAPAGRGLHHRPADVPARADDKVRLYLPQDGAGAQAAQRQVPKGNQVPRDVLRRQAALDAVHLDGMERITRLGDKAVLHSLLPSGEVYLRVRMAFFQRARNGERRVDVSGCAAGGDQYTHRYLLLSRNTARFQAPGRAGKLFTGGLPPLKK